MLMSLGKAGRVAVVAAMVFAATLAAGCNTVDSEATADTHVGPVGPTYPSKYYFDATVTPHSVLPPATVTFMIRVWDNNGNLVSGVPMTVAGAATSTTATTNDAGVAYIVYTISKSSSSSGAGVTYITVNIEDTVLTIPLQLIPSVV